MTGRCLWIALLAFLALAGCVKGGGPAVPAGPEVSEVLPLDGDGPPAAVCRAECWERQDAAAGEQPWLDELDPSMLRQGCPPPWMVPPELGLASLDSLEAYSQVMEFDRGIGRRLVTFISYFSPGGEPWTYFMHHKAGDHRGFANKIGCHGEALAYIGRGSLSFDPNKEVLYFDIGAQGTQVSPDNLLDYIWQQLQEHVAFLGDYPVYFVVDGEYERLLVENSTAWANGAEFGLIDARDLEEQTDYTPMNEGVAVGTIRFLSPGEVPLSSDIVVLDALPNSLPNVAGIVTSVPQTPLAHVNLRALQDQIPNIYIPAERLESLFRPLEGQLVRLSVLRAAYTVEPATLDEFLAFHESKRPWRDTEVSLDLSRDTIASFDELGALDAPAYGAKAANLAELASLDLPGVDVPWGVALPISFYLAFMEENGLQAEVDRIVSLAHQGADHEALEERLQGLRAQIRRGRFPAGIEQAINEVVTLFPPDTPLRCRSSTNNEDLPGFNGAGLYESSTHRPGEGPLVNTIRKIYDSLWGLQPFLQREYHRIDHRRVGMGVLIHPNHEGERINGVVSSFEPFMGYGDEMLYLNAQRGDADVTNPRAGQAVEETVVFYDTVEYEGMISLVLSGLEEGSEGSIVPEEHLIALRDLVPGIRSHFRRVLGVPEGRPFELEFEFKVMADGSLTIKQARPWVFPPEPMSPAECAAWCPAPAP